MNSLRLSGTRITLAGLLVAWAASLMASTAHATPVGHIQFLSGQVTLNQGKADNNSALEVGSTLKTGPDGFVHVRFIDDAFISLRPGSVLHVNAYHYNPDQPNENRVEFLLERGNLRSITGRSGESNKKGFMLNTPVAAIGIRGTDFVAVTDQINTRVRVISGAIMMRAGRCTGNTAGCWSDNDTVLSANDAHYLEVHQGQQPILKDLIELPSDSPLLEEAANPSGDNTLDSSEDDSLTLEHSNVELPEFNGEQQLDWGRWRGNHTVLQASTPLVSDKYTAGKQMVASTQIFGLMRNRADDPMQYWPSSGSLDLKLAASEAHLRKNTLLFAAHVNQGQLKLDFNNNRFNTQLSGTESYGNTQWQLQGSGDISAQGFLVGDTDNTATIKGALSTEGHQAGYIFSLPLDSLHSLEGATLWSR